MCVVLAANSGSVVSRIYLSVLIYYFCTEQQLVSVSVNGALRVF